MMKILHGGGLRASALLLLTLLGSGATSHTIREDGACPLLCLLPFSDASIFTGRDESRQDTNPEPTLSPQTMGHRGFTYMAAMLMAMDQFNARDASVVSALGNLGDCPVYFPENSTHVVDSALEYRHSVRAIMKYAQQNNDSPCALIGPAGEDPVIYSNVVAASLDLPLFTYDAVSLRVTEPDRFPTTVQTTPNTVHFVEHMISYLQRPRFDRKHVVVLYQGSAIMIHFARDFQRLGMFNGLNVVLQPFTPDPPGSRRPGEKTSIQRTMERVKLTGIRTIMILYERPSAITKFMIAADEIGLVDDDYLWLLFESAAPPKSITEIWGGKNETEDPAVARFLNGATVLSRLDGFDYDPHGDRFLSSWKQQDASFVNRLNAMTPLEPDREESFQATNDFFKSVLPAPGASIVYDSVIATGIGACNALADDDGNSENNSDGPMPPPSGKPPPPMNEPTPEGQPPPPPKTNSIANDHVRGISEASFEGASGTVAFGSRSNGQSPLNGAADRNRDRVGTLFGAFNVRLKVDSETGLTAYDAVLTSKVKGGGTWVDVAGEEFIYSDGTTSPPSLLREVGEHNYLSTWVRAIGLTLMSLSFFIGISACIAVIIWRRERSIQMSQPFFLCLLCLGTVIMASSILCLSFDENVGWDERQLDTACILTPWLFFIGHTVAHSAIFVKMWRVNRVLQFRRRKIKTIHVLWPIFVLLLVAVAILTAWTVVDPWEWHREFVSEIPPETFGECASDNATRFFVPLCCVLVLTTALATWMAWKTRDISPILSDSNGLFFAVSSELQAWFVGLPILAVLDGTSTDAIYLGRVLLISIFALCPVLILIGPKVYKVLKMKYFPSLGNSRQRKGVLASENVRVSGLFSVPNASSIMSTPNGSKQTLSVSAQPSVESSNVSQEEQQQNDSNALSGTKPSQPIPEEQHPDAGIQ